MKSKLSPLLALAAAVTGIPLTNPNKIMRPPLNEPPPKFDKERQAEALARRVRRENKRTANIAKSIANNPCLRP